MQKLQYLDALCLVCRGSQRLLRAPQKPHKSATRRLIPRDRPAAPAGRSGRAGIAAEHGLPFLVISAGTRNRFALDLGLNRDDDPATCLGALTSGEELRVDLGTIGARTLVNNASFGGYAEVIKSPAYQNDKRDTAPWFARHARPDALVRLVRPKVPSGVPDRL